MSNPLSTDWILINGKHLKHCQDHGYAGSQVPDLGPPSPVRLQQDSFQTCSWLQVSSWKDTTKANLYD